MDNMILEAQETVIISDKGKALSSLNNLRLDALDIYEPSKSRSLNNYTPHKTHMIQRIRSVGFMRT